MAATLKLEIVTPEDVVYSEDVEMVTLPAVAGQIGVYPLHTPLMTQMVPGEIIVHKNGRDVFIASGEGLIEVTSDRVSVLTDLAIAADRIDEAKVEEARRRAEARRRPRSRDLRQGSHSARRRRSGRRPTNHRRTVERGEARAQLLPSAQ